MFDDLQQLFGYRGAIDERTGVTEVGPDLLVVPCWTPQFCATVIRAAEAIGAFEPQADDPVPGHEVSLAVISPRLFETVQEDFGTRIWPQLAVGVAVRRLLRPARRVRHPLRARRAGVAADPSRRRPGVGLDQAQRRLRRCRVGVSHGRRSTTPELRVGEMLVWPSLVTHPHETAQLDSGVKYALTVWFELPSF